VRRVVGADASRDAFYDPVVVRSEKERDRISRGVVLIDDAVRRRAEVRRSNSAPASPVSTTSVPGTAGGRIHSIRARQNELLASSATGIVQVVRAMRLRPLWSRGLGGAWAVTQGHGARAGASVGWADPHQ
jgi:hypothetical protein